MAINIIKKGSNPIEMTCKKCGCVFTYEKSDIDFGLVECPYCKTKINTQVENIEDIKRKIKENCLREIDLVKIHNHMENVGWSWADAEFGIPTEDEIKKCMFKLIDEAIDRKCTIKCGGFIVKYREYEADGEYPHTIGVDVTFYVNDICTDVCVDNLQEVFY